MNPTSAPSREVLERYLLGTLDGSEEGSVESWMETNPDAANQLLSSLSPRDTLTDSLASVNLDEQPDREIESRIIERVLKSDSTVAVQPGSIPERFGSCRRERQLGAGGMGIVFEATDEQLDRKVAVKILKPEAAKVPLAKERFLQEARAVAKVKHHHVIEIYHIGEEAGIPYIVMPLLEGEPLDRRFHRLLHANQLMPIAEVVRIGWQIAEGLAAAHTKGLIHRDIKPGNIWLEGPKGRAIILDFGLARQENAVHLTQTGAILGTPAYMSPEQADGIDKLDARCDLFSLGAMLYELTTGERPFPGNTPGAIFKSLALVDPKPPDKLVPTVPLRLSNLIMKLLEKEAQNRPPSAEKVANELHAIAEEPSPSSSATQTYVPRPKDTPVAEPHAKETVSPVIYTEVTPPAPQPQAEPKSKKKIPWKIIGFSLAASILLIVLGIVLLLPTKDGVIRIEINDPEIQVTLNQTGATFTGAGPHEIKVSPGEFGFKVKRGDFEFDTTRFELKKGDKVTLKVEYQAGKVQVVKDGQVIGSGEPSTGGAGWKPTFAKGGPSRLDNLQADRVPLEVRTKVGAKELVAVIGTPMVQKKDPWSAIYQPGSNDGGWTGLGLLTDRWLVLPLETKPRKLGVWDVTGPAPRRIDVPEDNLTWAGWAEKDRFYAVQNESDLHAVEVKSDRLMISKTPRLAKAQGVWFTPDGKFSIAQLPEGVQRKNLTDDPPSSGIFPAKVSSWPLFSPDHSRYGAFVPGEVTWSAKEFRIFDIASDNLDLLCTIPNTDWGRFLVADFAPDGKTVAIGSEKPEVQFWDVSSKTPKLVARRPFGPARNISFAPDGRSVVVCASTRDGSNVFEYSWPELKQTRGWENLLSVRAYHIDARHLLLINADGTAYVFRLAPPPK